MRLTAGLSATYAACSPAFAWSPRAAPRRVLTKPSAGAHNGGRDNARGDLILAVGDVLVGASAGRPPRAYTVHDLIGQGTFGQVVRAEHGHELVAIKVVRNKPAYTKQGLVEIGIVEHLNRVDPDDRHHVVRLMDYFVWHNHVCLVFELLSVNLYELLRVSAPQRVANRCAHAALPQSNGYRGLSVNLVRVFVGQLLDACDLLRRHNIVHCDLYGPAPPQRPLPLTATSSAGSRRTSCCKL